MELSDIQTTGKGRVYYLASHTNVGLVCIDRDALLIDSGLDDDAAKKIDRIAVGKNVGLHTVISTHHHADHCGGNAYLQRVHPQMAFLAPDVEAALISSPELEPMYLFGSPDVPKELRNKFLQAQPTRNVAVLPAGRFMWHDYLLDVVPLQGHSPNQIGIGVGKNVLFCADSVFGEEVLAKHKIPFYMDIGSTRKTFEWLRQSDYQLYVPSHGEPFGDIASVVSAHEEVVDSVEDYVRNSLRGKMTFDDLLRTVCDGYSAPIDSLQRYVLMKTVISGFVSHLYEKGELCFAFDKNVMYLTRK